MVTPNGIAVGCTTDRVYVRVVGRGTFQNSQPLSVYSAEMLARGFARFTVDIGQCTAMDSTFLGVLAGIGLRVGQKHPGTQGEVCLVNVDGRQHESLVTLGLDRLFVIQPANGQPESTAMPGDVTLQPLPESDSTTPAKRLHKDITARVMLDAHTNLIRADPHNEPKFAELTAQLQQRLGKPKSPPAAPGQGAA